MKKICVLLLSFLFLLDAGAQLSVGSAENLSLPAGATLSFKGLALTPSGATHTISNNVLSFSTTPATQPGAAAGITQVYNWTTAQNFTGALQLKYETGNLNGNAAADLRLSVLTGNNWQQLTNTTVNTNSGTLQASVTALGYSSLTAGSNAFLVAPTLGSFSVPAKTFGVQPFIITAPTSNSNGAFTYTSSNTAVATISGNTITIVSGGTATITALQAATSSFAAASTTATLTVSKATQEIDWTVLPGTMPLKDFTSPVPVRAAATSSLPVTITLQSGSVATLNSNGDLVNIGQTGTVTLLATQAGNSNYEPASLSATFDVTKSNQALTFGAINNGTAVYTPGLILPLSGTATSTLPINYQVVSGPATITGSTLNVTGSGTIVVEATQPGNTLYNATPALRQTVQVSKGTPQLSGFAGLSKIFGDAAFTIAAPQSQSAGAFTYTSSDASAATVNGSTITITGAGTATITATQAADGSFESNAITAILTVGKATPVVQQPAGITKTFGDAAFALTAPQSTSSGAFSYTSSNTGVATISGNTVTITGAGTTTITALQAADANFVTASKTFNLTVSKANPAAGSFSIANKAFGDAPFAITDPVSNSNSAFTYTSSNTSVATISGTTITIIGAGATTITASQPATANYTAGTATAVFTVQPAQPVVGSLSVSPKTYGNAPFTLTTPTSNSSGAWSYTSSNTSVATVSGNTVTIVGGGTASITATQAATANYSSATVSSPLVVSLATNTLSGFGNLSATYGDADIQLTAPGSNSAGAFTYTSSNTSVATISGTTVTIVGAGTTTITATQAAAGNYGVGTTTATLTVAKAAQAITWTALPGNTPLKDFNNIPVPVRATASSGLPVTISLGTNSVATLDNNGDLVSIGSTGTVTIKATQAGNANYLPASISASFDVVKSNQAITFNAITSGTAAYTSGLSFPLVATSDANLQVSFAVISGPATINGTTLQVIGVGNIIVEATQAGDNSFNLAPAVRQVLQVQKGTPQLSGFAAMQKTFGDADFTLATPASASTGNFSYSSGDAAVAQVQNGTVTITGAGTIAITATQDADDNFNSATITATLTVAQANPVTTTTNLQKTFGDAAFTLAAPKTNSTGGFSYASADNTIGSVNSGLLTVGNAGTTTITATQAADANYNAGTATFTFTVVPAVPNFSGFASINKTFGDAAFQLQAPASPGTGTFTYTSSNQNVAAINGATVSIVEIGTAIITATQAAAGNYTQNSITTLLTVEPATPALTGFQNISKNYGDAAFTITAPQSSSNGAITYTSNNTSVATINNNTVTIVGGGTTIITATQAATNNYNSNVVTAALTVAPAAPVITTPAAMQKLVGTGNFQLADPVSTSNGAWSWTSSNNSVATVNGNTVALQGVGVTTFTANQSPTANYTGGTTSFVLTVVSSDPGLSNFNVAAKTYGDPTFVLTAPTSISPAAFTYASSDNNVATISGNQVTIRGAGTATITATQSASSFYPVANITANLVVSKANPVITQPVAVSQTYGDVDFTMATPVSNSNGAWTYTSSDNNVVVANGSMAHIAGGGSATITATQAATANYNSGTTTISVSVAAAANPLSWIQPISKVYGNQPFALTDPVSNSSGAFNYISSDNTVATINGNTVTIVGAGSATITATQAATASYNSATINATLTVAKATPVLATPAAISKVYGDAAFSLTAPQSNSTGAFTYTSSNTGVAAINGNTVTIVGAGTATITYTQASDANYNGAVVTTTLTVAKANPVVSAMAAISKTFGDAAFQLATPQSNSSGAITFSSSNTGVATINGNTVTIVGAGTVTITATQAATANYNAATVSATLTVAKATPVLPTPAAISKVYGDAAFSLTAPQSNSTGAFTYTSSNSGVAEVAGSTLTIRGAGTATITYTQAADANYNGASVSTTITVAKANPVVSAMAAINKTFGDATFQLAAPASSSNGAITYSSSNTGVATVNGNTVTMLAAGTTTITVSQAATASFNAASVSTTLTVFAATAQPGALSIPAKAYGDRPFVVTNPASNGTGVWTYSSSNTAVATVAGNTITIVGAGTATITATQAPDRNFNSVSVSAVLSVAKAPLTITAGSTFRCVGYVNPQFTYAISGYVNGEGASVLQSLPVVQTTAAQSSVAGTYAIAASGAQAANYTFTYVNGVLTVNNPQRSAQRYPVVDAISGEATPLQARSFGTQYQWAPATGLNNSRVAMTTTTLQKEQQYTIAITEATGCIITDTVLVRTFQKPDVFVPSLFSPNGDGVNDELRINPVGMKQLYYFRIFDRYGKVLFETRNLNEGWNGRFNGQLQRMDTYSWILSGQDKNGKWITTSGSVTLVR